MILMLLRIIVLSILNKVDKSWLELVFIIRKQVN